MASNNHIEIIDGWDFESERLKELYCENVIALSKQINTSKEKACILAEELGHYHTTTGNIMDQKDTMNRKQEYRARIWVYNKQIDLQGLIEAYKARCITLEDMAEYLKMPYRFIPTALVLLTKCTEIIALPKDILLRILLRFALLQVRACESFSVNRDIRGLL